MYKPNHYKKLKRGVKYWNEWRRINSVANPELPRSKLIGAHLSHADLKGADLSGAKLTNAKMRATELNNAILDKANLKKCRNGNGQTD